MPFVSVIIPNYNHAPFLKQRIDSVLGQNWQDFEVIILDDCSTDYSREVIESYRGNPKIKSIIYNNQNSGSPFKQWQKGIELSEGKLIWIAESDDYANEALLNTLVQPFIHEPLLILSYCQSVIVDESSKPVRLLDWADALDELKWKQDYIESTSVELENYLSFRNTIPNASAVLFRKPSNVLLLEESTKMKMLGDWLFWRKLLSQEGKVAFFCAPLNFFRLHSQTTRNATTKEKELTRMKEYRRLIIPRYLNIYDKRYDWMIHEWFANRRVLKNTNNYFVPDLPFILIIRFFLIGAAKISGKFFR